MTITIQGTRLDLTDGIRRYVEEKLDDAFRAFGDMDRTSVAVAVELEVTTLHHRNDAGLYRAEANVSLPGRMLRAEASADDLYRAITEMKHTLTREIRRWRERLIDEARQGARQATAMPEPDRLDDEEEAWEIWDETEEREDDTADDAWVDWETEEEDERDFI